MPIDDQIRQALDRAIDGVRGRLEADLRALAQDLESQILDLRTALADAGRRAQAEIEDAHHTAQTQVDDVQRAMDERVADFEGRLADTGRRLTDALQELAEARASSAARVEAAQLISRRAAADQLRRLVDATRALDEAASLGEVLERLARGVAGDADRVAVLVVRGERLVGWSLIGFGANMPNPRAISLDSTEAGLSATAVRTGAAASQADATEALPSFARDAGPRHALALPVIVGGVPVAALYADVPAGDSRADERWPAVLEVLVRHAGTVLEALTVRQAAGLQLPQPVARASHDVVHPSHDRGVQ